MSVGFTENQFVKKLHGLKTSEDSIKTLSEWCLLYKKHADDIVNIWAREFKAAADNTARVSLYYWVNEIIQQSKRRGSPFPDKFARVLPDALRESYASGDAKYQQQVQRVLAIWQTRAIYTVSFFENIASVLGFDTKVLNKDLVEKKLKSSSSSSASSSIPSRPSSVTIASSSSSTPTRDRLRGSDATPPLTPTDSPYVPSLAATPTAAAGVTVPSSISSPVAKNTASSSSTSITAGNGTAVAAQKASADPIVKALLELEGAATEDQRVATKVVGILPDLKVMATLEPSRAKRCMDVIVKHKWRLQQGVKRRKALIELLQASLAGHSTTVQKQTNDITECTTQLNKLSAIAGIPVPIGGTPTAAASPSSASSSSSSPISPSSSNGKRKADGTSSDSKDESSTSNDKRAKVESVTSSSSVPFVPPTDPRRRPAPPSPALSSSTTSGASVISSPQHISNGAPSVVSIAPLGVPLAVAAPAVAPVSGDVLDGINGLLANLNGDLLAAIGGVPSVV